MITLSNGHRIQYVASSGSLGKYGEGALPWERVMRRLGIIRPSEMTVVTKTITRHSVVGNLDYAKSWANCFRFVDKDANPLGLFDVLFRPSKIAGTINAVGLTNEGMDAYFARYGETIENLQGPFVISITGDNFHDISELAAQCARLLVAAIELNASCPNKASDPFSDSHFLVRACDHIYNVAGGKPILLKLSVSHDFETIFKHLRGNMVQAIELNSIAAESDIGKKILNGKKSPLAHLGGGAFSGKICQPYYEEAIAKMRKLTDIPIIAPVWDYADIRKWRNVYGIDQFSFGSVFIRWPWRPNRMIRRDKKENPA